jgi:hypothetical protein
MLETGLQSVELKSSEAAVVVVETQFSSRFTECDTSGERISDCVKKSFVNKVNQPTMFCTVNG